MVLSWSQRANIPNSVSAQREGAPGFAALALSDGVFLLACWRSAAADDGGLYYSYKRPGVDSWSIPKAAVNAAGVRFCVSSGTSPALCEIRARIIVSWSDSGAVRATIFDPSTLAWGDVFTVCAKAQPGSSPVLGHSDGIVYLAWNGKSTYPFADDSEMIYFVYRYVDDPLPWDWWSAPRKVPFTEIDSRGGVAPKSTPALAVCPPRVTSYGALGCFVAWRMGSKIDGGAADSAEVLSIFSWDPPSNRWLVLRRGPNNIQMTSSPTLCCRGNQFLMVWPDSEGGALWLSVANKLGVWSKHSRINDFAVGSGMFPSLSVLNETIYLVWIESDGSGIWYASTSEGDA